MMALRISLVGLAVVLLTIYALGQGVITLGFAETLHYIWLTAVDPTGAGSIRQDVLQYLRLPNLVLSFLVGAGLAVCGAVMQAVVRNPLADPYLLGVSRGQASAQCWRLRSASGPFWDSTGRAPLPFWARLPYPF